MFTKKKNEYSVGQKLLKCNLSNNTIQSYSPLLDS